MNKYLIVGLGNIGLDYINTRHNIGFSIIEHFSLIYSSNFILKKNAELANFKLKGRLVYLLKPTTLMNLSGKAVNYYLNDLKIPLENSLIISDDLNLEFGQIRLRKKGSDGGHNGHKSIAHHLNSSNYPRLRFGIGKNFRRGGQSKYVLSTWSPSEKLALNKKLELSSNIISNFILSGIENTMNMFND